MISIRDVGLGSEEDPPILEWAAQAGYAVVTHDVSTMTAAANDRLRRGLPMRGLIVVPQRIAIGEAVRRLVEVLESASSADLDGRILYL